jgi:hypothetical protein
MNRKYEVAGANSTRFWNIRKLFGIEASEELVENILGFSTATIFAG